MSCSDLAQSCSWAGRLASASATPALALVLTTLCASATSAAVITQTLSAAQGFNSSTTFDFIPFDPDLGTLTDVTASLSGDVLALVTVNDNSAADQTVRTDVFGSEEVLGPNLLFDTLGYSAESGDAPAPAGSATATYQRSGSASAPLTGFIAGAGLIEITVRDVANPLLQQGCCSVSGLAGDDDPTVTLTYNFTSATIHTSRPVTELSTWAMTLLGFAGLGFAGYRASRRAAVGSLVLRG
jgi:hypothetical protein